MSGRGLCAGAADATGGVASTYRGEYISSDEIEVAMRDICVTNAKVDRTFG